MRADVLRKMCLDEVAREACLGTAPQEEPGWPNFLEGRDMDQGSAVVSFPLLG